MPGSVSVGIVSDGSKGGVFAMPVDVEGVDHALGGGGAVAGSSSASATGSSCAVVLGVIWFRASGRFGGGRLAARPSSTEPRAPTTPHRPDAQGASGSERGGARVSVFVADT